MRNCLFLAVCAGLLSLSGNSQVITGNSSLKHEVKRSLERGQSWLIKNQSPEGWWSTTDQPAVTALALAALKNDLGQPTRRAALDLGYGWLGKWIQPDGSIYNPQNGLANYNTSIGLLAFVARDRVEDRGLILKARRYLVSTQVDLGTTNNADTPFDGGIGYGSKYKHSDMGNTLAALEALYVSRAHAADTPNEPKLNFDAARQFLQNCQNLPSHNKQPWASGDPQNGGGFIYYPGHSMAGSNMLANGKVALRSYGSISYAGLLSYIYADMDKNDPRVQAVVKWLDGNFTLEENPGMGAQGLFYYFHTMTKALTLANIENVGGKPWREPLALKLMNLQKDDGSWQNENARWWEKDSALVTSYVVLTLRMLESRL